MFEKPISSLDPTSLQAVSSNSPHVVFVGSALAFSDQSVRAFSAEFPNLNTVRVAGLPDLHLFSQIHPDIALVIFEQCFADQFCTQLSLLRRACNAARVVIAYSDPVAVTSVFQSIQSQGDAGSIGYLPMNRSLDAWLAISRLLICGEDYVPPEMLDQHSAPCAQSPVTPKRDAVAEKEQAPCETLNDLDSTLTAREFQVLQAVSLGKQNKIIASDLDISEHTVKLHIHNIIKKLGVSNRTAASAWFHAHHPTPSGPSSDHPHG
ncbi:MAG: response regulator transcription factor [Pseudomonadota bacterium]